MGDDNLTTRDQSGSLLYYCVISHPVFFRPAYRITLKESFALRYVRHSCAMRCVETESVLVLFRPRMQPLSLFAASVSVPCLPLSFFIIYSLFFSISVEPSVLISVDGLQCLSFSFSVLYRPRPLCYLLLDQSFVCLCFYLCLCLYFSLSLLPCCFLALSISLSLKYVTCVVRLTAIYRHAFTGKQHCTRRVAGQSTSD